MKIIKPYVEIVTPINSEWVLQHIENCYRICYQSESKNNTEQFLKDKILRLEHLSPLEHFSFTAYVVTDRGVSHEIVRHRIGSYSQESSRYCNYSKDRFCNEITVIEPSETMTDEEYRCWFNGCKYAEQCYLDMLSNGATPQKARAVLPNSLKTSLYMTYNLREWRHFFKLRCDKKAHPDMRVIALMLLKQANEKIPVVFDDIYSEYQEEIEKDF